MPNFSADAEYQMLRDEIVQGKKYVFERPILIVAACVTLVQFDRTMLPLLPIAVLGLLGFNLWFTANRLYSMARIIAYIAVVLEGADRKPGGWQGWESSLVTFRKWQEDDGGEFPHVPVDRKDLPRGLGFYPPIFSAHVALGAGACLLPFIAGDVQDSIVRLQLVLVYAVTLGMFCWCAWNYRPDTVRNAILRYRRVWEALCPPSANGGTPATAPGTDAGPSPDPEEAPI